MKKLLFLILFLISVSEIKAQWLTGYNYQKKITIDNTQVSGSVDLIDYPFLVRLMDNELKSESYGGLVFSENGWDIRFTEDDGTTLLDHEVELFTASTGELVVWVRIPVLSYSEDKEIYIYFGNQSVVSDPSTPTTWSSDFRGVWHMSGNVEDASQNINNGLNNGATSTVGKIGGAFYFDGSDNVVVPNTSSLNLQENISTEAWVRLAPAGPGKSWAILSKLSDYGLNYLQDEQRWYAGEYSLQIPYTLTEAEWIYISATYNRTIQRVYVNGVQIGSVANSTQISNDTGADLGIGHFIGNTLSQFTGDIDEVKLLSVALSEDWIKTSYNNQSNPGLFFSSSTTEAASGLSFNLVVTTTSDISDGNVTSVESLNMDKGTDGHISLREAISAANNTTGLDTINFNIPGAGPHTINILSVLPTISDTLIIDGWSEPDFSITPIVGIDGASAGNVSALTFSNTSDGSIVRGLMITRFTSNGIQVNLDADGITIAGNWIGTTGTGSTAVGNSNYGINVLGANTIIGGIGPYDGNVITNNGNEGINLSGSGATGTIIKGNIIGLDPDGSTGSGNSDVGIAILTGADSTIVGGNTEAQRNIISKNYEGIEINSINNVVQGNYIGTDMTGTLNRGNRSDDGVEIQNSSTGNIIGGIGTGEGNLIAFNALDGIYVASGTDNSLLGNRIHSNNGLGIDLGANGVTANDGGDVDIGANNLQNYPILTTAVPSGGNITITGSFFSTGFTSFRIEFFSSPDGDGSGYGEGQTYLGYKSVTTPGSGAISISTTLIGVSVSAGSIVTATATVDLGGSYGNTSEFSAGVTVSNPIVIDKVITNVLCNSGSDGAIDITVSGGTPDYSYSWSHGPTTEDASGLTAGDYTITVTDADLNSQDSTFTITEPSLLNATLSSSGVSCLGSTDATITISAPGGGSGSYEYTIHGGDPWQTSGSFTNLSADSYDVRIRDALAVSCEVILNSALDLTNSNDVIAPVILCPDDLSAVCNISEQPAYANYAAFISAGGSATDNCSIDEASFILLSEVSNGLTCPETVSRTYQIADDNGNTATCEQDILINDITDPSFDTFPGDLTAECDISERPAYSDYAAFVDDGGSASDNCSINSASFILVSEVSDGLSNPETVTRTYRIADLCGNTNTYIQNITITDDEDPVITCPGDRIENLDDNCDFLIPDYTATATVNDNCDPAPSVTQSPVAGTLLSGEGSIQTITILATDNSGNSANCTFNIVLQDNTPPSISCLPDTIITTVEGIYDIDLSLAVPVVNDNCGIQSLTNDYSSEPDAGGFYPVGTTILTYTATDLIGNSSQCSRQVTIKFGDEVPYGLVIPQGFSPNNDGLNDVFEIIGIDAYPDNELFVYNVWGKEVYHMATYDNSWDGKASKGVSAGQNLPTATYFYVLKLDNDLLVKGSVYLIIE